MKRKLILILIIIVIIGSGAGIGSYFWYQSVHYVKTEDARLAGEIYRVMPKISGKLNTLTIKQGDTVVADQIVGQQDITNLSSTLLDQASLRSPVSGTVIHTSAKPGEVVTPGQSVAMIVDKKKHFMFPPILKRRKSKRSSSANMLNSPLIHSRAIRLLEKSMRSGTPRRQRSLFFLRQAQAVILQR